MKAIDGLFFRSIYACMHERFGRMNACIDEEEDEEEDEMVDILFLGGFSSSCTCFFRGQPLFLFGHSLVASVEATKAQPHGFVLLPLPSLSFSLCVSPYPMLLFSPFLPSLPSPSRLHKLYFPLFPWISLSFYCGFGDDD